jgi:hypothetical protein
MALGERQKLYGSVTLLTVFRSPDWMNIIIYSFSFPVEAVLIVKTRRIKQHNDIIIIYYMMQSVKSLYRNMTLL